jgi:excisionase family DNA binding protein
MKKEAGMAKRRVRPWPEIEQSGGLATIKEVAQHLQLSVPTVYGLIKKGKLPAVKLGDIATRVRPQDVNALVEQGGVGPRPKKMEPKRDYRPAPVREVG